MFIKASRLKLKVQTPKGNLPVDDLWELTLTQLNAIAKDLKRQLNETQEEDFLEEKTPEDELIKLRFDIVLYILNTKKAEKKAQEESVVLKAEREQILALMADKKAESLKNLSEEDLQKKLDEINSKIKS